MYGGTILSFRLPSGERLFWLLTFNTVSLGAANPNPPVFRTDAGAQQLNYYGNDTGCRASQAPLCHAARRVLPEAAVVACVVVPAGAELHAASTPASSSAAPVMRSVCIICMRDSLILDLNCRHHGSGVSIARNVPLFVPLFHWQMTVPL